MPTSKTKRGQKSKAAINKKNEIQQKLIEKSNETDQNVSNCVIDKPKKLTVSQRDNNSVLSESTNSNKLKNSSTGEPENFSIPNSKVAKQRVKNIAETKKCLPDNLGQEVKNVEKENIEISENKLKVILKTEYSSEKIEKHVTQKKQVMFSEIEEAVAGLSVSDLTDRLANDCQISSEKKKTTKKTLSKGSKIDKNKLNKDVIKFDNKKEEPVIKKDNKQEKTSQEPGDNTGNELKITKTVKTSASNINVVKDECIGKKEFTNKKITEKTIDSIIDEQPCKEPDQRDKEANDRESKSKLNKSKKDNIIRKPVLNYQKSKKSSNQVVTKSNSDHKITEYFAERRSVRKPAHKILEEKQIELQFKIINGCEDGLEIREFLEKGRGIITTKKFFRGDFVVEYAGDLIDIQTARKREELYKEDPEVGCYMYYFNHQGKSYCIDSTAESGKLGRLINHSKKGNLVSRIIEIDSIPHLVLFAKVDVDSGTELSYDYGDRSRESLKHHPWLSL